MYDFHYNYIKKKFPDSKLLFTDTDSLFYHIKSEKDIYEEFWLDIHLFDNSDYPDSSKYFSDKNKKVIGKFKDEAAGKLIKEFVGLKSKMYSYTKYLKPEDYKKKEKPEIKKAKGIRTNVVENQIKHEDYLYVLNNNITMHHQMNTIRSELHQINSYHLNKVSLSTYDDKRYLLDDGITSYAYGHYLI